MIEKWEAHIAFTSLNIHLMKEVIKELESAPFYKYKDQDFRIYTKENPLGGFTQLIITGEGSYLKEVIQHYLNYALSVVQERF